MFGETGNVDVAVVFQKELKSRPHVRHMVLVGGLTQNLPKPSAIFHGKAHVTASVACTEKKQAHANQIQLDKRRFRQVPTRTVFLWATGPLAIFVVARFRQESLGVRKLAGGTVIPERCAPAS